MNLDRRLLRLTRSVRLGLGLTILLGLLGGILMVLQAGLLSGAIDRVFLGGASLADVTPLLLGLAGSPARALATWGGTVTGQQVRARIKQELRERCSPPAGTRHGLHPGGALGELAIPCWWRRRTGRLLSQYLPQMALAALVR
jgi:ABC-type transport system involved in cytochrome bd biosynthesis fused ATPase/permease subunit